MSDEKDKKPPTLEEALGDTFDKIQARENEPEKEIKEEVKEEVKEEKEPEKPKKRGEDGKFVKQSEEKPEESEEPKDSDQKGEKAYSSPPASWSAAGKALWDQLPPDVRAEAHKQERDFQRFQSRTTTEKKQYEGLERVLSPRRNQLAAMYGSVDRALEQLFALSDFAQNDPQGFVQYFAQQRGLNLSSFAQPGRQPLDPNIAALQQQMQALNGAINSFQTQHQQTIQNDVGRQYEAFANDPKNIYFEEVKYDMADLLDSGQAMNFSDAYEKAIWLNPGVREKVLSASRKEAEAKRLKEAEEKAKEAKRVQATNVATKGVTGSSPAPKSIDDTIQQTADALYG